MHRLIRIWLQGTFAYGYARSVLGARPLGWLLMALALLLPGGGWAASQAALAGSVVTVCPSGCDHTTIQAAINAASDGDTVRLLSSSPHTEAGITVNKDLVIEGMGRDSTTIQAAVIQATATDRVFLISGGTVEIRDMTIRHGLAPQGGGILNGGALTISRAALRLNRAGSGGGIYNTTNGRLAMRDALMVQNSAQTGAGIYNAGTVVAAGSNFWDNADADQGGALFNSGAAALSDSTFISNYANDATPAFLEGGAIYSSGLLYLLRSSVIDNYTGTGTTGFGGGIYSTGELIVHDSEVNENSSHVGSGLTILGGNVEIKGTTISQNGVADQEEGGGMAIGGGATVIIADSRISDHHARSGGGLLIATSDVTIVDSAIYDNEVLIHGGGLLICSIGAKLVNVTISGNEADEDGGGIYVCPTGAVSLANVTISDNEADRNADDAGNGGGLYLHTSGNDTGMAYWRNTIVAGNADLSPGRTAVRAPDCFGGVESQGYNLIGALGSSPSGYPCFITGNTAGTIIGEGAELEALADNGGPTLTHALLPTSLAINRGNPAGCRDFDNNLLAADQRHATRIDRCDLGAYEFGGLVERLFLPAIRKP